MEDLYGMGAEPVPPTCYTLIVTTLEDGTYCVTAPDFPDIQFEGTDCQSGILYVKERIEDELLTLPVPPLPTPLTQFSAAGNQMAIQIAV